jgi:hypothetical protein
VDFDPSLGAEVQKTRPAVIVGNDASNRNLNRVQVVPVTSNVTRVYPCWQLCRRTTFTLSNEPCACSSGFGLREPAPRKPTTTTKPQDRNKVMYNVMYAGHDPQASLP